jgi:tetratricopeptide (TPR) repeat protein
MADLRKAIELDKNECRYGKLLVTSLIMQKQYAAALETAASYAARFPQNYIIGMLHIKTLQLNMQYAQAAARLDKINIIPFEGSTDGRVLYKETHLLMAVEAIKNNNCKEALQHIEKARQWPENIGVGKPYADQIDERAENWLSYHCYAAAGNKAAAQKALQKILAFKPVSENTVSNFSEANAVVTAWAMDKTGNKTAAKNLLEERLKNDPANPIKNWCLQVFNGNMIALPSTITTDENYRVLSAWLLINK